ncbi:hypothetical protein B0H11DRAFT_1928662 [Mycena galericulata]|nr:hypothetical protein B0H11DRAFT_1928662 [Mycena galericulata]
MDDLPGREKARLTGAIACGAKASENKGKSENGNNGLNRNRNKLIITSRVNESLQIHNVSRRGYKKRVRPPLSPVATDDHKQKSWRIAQRLLLSLLFLRRQLLVIKALIGGVPTHHYVLPRAPFSFRSSKTGSVQFHMDILSPHETSGRGKRNNDFMYWRQGLVRDHPSSWLYADRQCKISNSPAKPIAFGAMDDVSAMARFLPSADPLAKLWCGLLAGTLAIRLLVGISPRSRTLGAVQTVSDPASKLN